MPSKAVRPPHAEPTVTVAKHIPSRQPPPLRLTVNAYCPHARGRRTDDDKVANMPGETVQRNVPHRAMITACAIGATVLQLLDQRGTDRRLYRRLRAADAATVPAWLLLLMMRLPRKAISTAAE